MDSLCPAECCVTSQLHACRQAWNLLAPAAFFRAQVQDFWYSDVTCLGQNNTLMSTDSSSCKGAVDVQQTMRVEQYMQMHRVNPQQAHF
jgi:hypothetical protein